MWPQPVGQSISWLQIRLFGPYLNSFSTNSYGYYSQMSQDLASNIQVFASALIVRQAASDLSPEPGQIADALPLNHENRNRSVWRQPMEHPLHHRPPD